MNSVFHAFSKSSKADASGGGGGGTNGNASSSGKGKHNSKKLLASSDPTSYENLRHVREIAYSSKMTNYVPTNGDTNGANDDPSLIVTKVTPLQSPMLNGKHHEFDVLGLDFTEQPPSEDEADCAAPSSTALAKRANGIITNGEHSSEHSPVNGEDDGLLMPPPIAPKLKDQNHKLNVSSSSVSSSDDHSSSNFINNVKNNRSEGFGSRFLKPRLSLSSVGSAVGLSFGASNHNSSNGGGSSAVVSPSNNLSSSSSNATAMPSVHRRSNGAMSSPSNGAKVGVAPTRQRLSTHQRNLSLDFR